VRLRQSIPQHPIEQMGPATTHSRDRAVVLDRLRESIQRIEGRTARLDIPPVFGAEAPRHNLPDHPSGDPHEDGGCALPRTALPPAPPSSPSPAPVSNVSISQAWTLGAATADDMIGPAGLDPGGVHEIKPVGLRTTGTSACETAAWPSSPDADWSAAWGAARVFALALLSRRFHMLARSGDTTRLALWCQVRASVDDLGAIYAPGLAAFGIAAKRLLIVEVDTARDALWVLEEALRAGSLALVAGTLEAVDLTPARRLRLAAQAHRTPCLVLTHPQAQPMAATASRWRIGPLASAPHPFARGSPTAPGSGADRLPGARRLVVGLERLRAQPLAGMVSQACVSWCDETFRFRMAAPVRDRADETGTSWLRTA
jgi:hypothetical protein